MTQVGLQYRRLLGLVALLPVVLLALPSVAAAQVDPVAVFRQAVDTRNRGDLAGFLALFTPDAVRQDGSCPTGCSGEVLRRSFEQNIAEHFEATVLSAQAAENTVTARAELRSDVFRARGAERVVSNFTVQLRDGKIARWVSTPDTSDPQTAAYQAALQAQAAQAQTADPVAVVAAYVAATNAGDVAAAQALVTPDAVLRFGVGSVASPDGTRFTGPEGVAARLQVTAAAGNVHDEVVAPQASGDRVTWTNLHSNDPFRRLGVAPLVQRGEATVQQGKVAALTLSFTPEDAARLQMAQSLDAKQTFDAALAAGDVDAALATFTPDARFTTPGGAVLTGTAAIRAYLQELIAGGYRATMAESRAVAPDRVVSRGSIALDQFRRLGLASVEATAEVVALGSRITAFTVALTPAAAARVQAAQAAAQRRPAGLPRTGGAELFAQLPLPVAVPAGVALLATGLAAGWSRRRRS